MTRSTGIPLTLATMTIISFACVKADLSDEQGQTQRLDVFLTDHPGHFEKVLVQINTVEVKLDTSSHQDDDDYGLRQGDMDDDDDDHRRGSDKYGQWDTLRMNPGTYDLLTLRNGVDTLLAQGNINGRVRKIRISVGAVNVVQDGVTYPVNMMPGLTNYIYVKVKREHLRDSSNVSQLWVDFDVSRSIVEINGQFFLRPVLKPFCDKSSGELEGEVTPREAQTVVKVYNATDTATALPDKDGDFRIRGLDEGSYSVLYDGTNGYRDTLIANVTIRKGRRTELPDVKLKK